MYLRPRSSYKLLALLIAGAIILIVIFNSLSNRSSASKFLNGDLVSSIDDGQEQQEQQLPVQMEEINVQTLVNLTNFNYTIDNDICTDYANELLGVIIVTSYAGHDELRAAHRQAIAQSKLSEMGLLRVFLLAELPSKEKFITQEQIHSEQKRFGDLLQGNFVESYRNLSYKHIMGLRWAALDCQEAKFIVKVDDDIVYDVYHLKHYLQSLQLANDKHDFLAGYVLEKPKPYRISASKWYVSPEEFDGDNYPDYLSGWLYIVNQNTALRLVRRSQTTPLFWIDDIWVTGLLRQREHVHATALNAWFSGNAEFLECCINDLKDHNYECEFYVGPNGGDTKLIATFTQNVEKCYVDKCLKRSIEKSLKQTCVADAKHFLPDHGEALVREVKLR